MKKMVIIITMALIGTLCAQPTGSKPQMGQHQPPPIPDEAQIVKMVDELTQILSLSNEQTVKINKLYTDHFSQAKMKMEAEKNDHEQHRKEMDALREEFENDVKAVLNSAQIEKFEEHLRTHNPQNERMNRSRK